MNSRHVLLCAVLLLWACILPAAAHTVIEAPSGDVAAGSSATFLLGIGDVTDIEGAVFTLTWNPELFSVTSIAPLDGASALRIVSLIQNDEGRAQVVVTCPTGITVATDTCEPMVAVTVAAGDETGTATIGIAMAEYSTGFLPAVFDEAAEGVITITGGYQTVSAPDAAFSAAPVTGTAPLVVTFVDLSTGTPDTWSWDFGDGSTSSEANPVHTYESAGTYNVSLTVTNEGGSDTLTREGYITASLPTPVASFSAADSSGTIPLTVSFTDSSSGDNLVYSWDFGDGTTSSDASPVHTYTSAGTYDVTLTVTNYRTDISDTMMREGYISAVLPAPVAGFSAVDTSGTFPLTVSFTDSSSGDNLVYSWDFGDGTTSSDASPVHTYTSAGTYDVTLTVTNEAGSDTAIRSGYIIVAETANDPLDANFTAPVVTGPAPLEVSFIDTSAGSPVRWWWIFGDSSSMEFVKNPVHVYNTPGSYTVALYVGDGVNYDRETKLAYIVVTEADSAAPAASFSATPVAGTTPLAVMFMDTSTDALTWCWDFGDGATATVQHPVHTYAEAGTYTVRLTVTNEGGSDTLTREGYITASLPAPVAVISAVDTTGTVPLAVSFNDSSSGDNLVYSWDFGDGKTSSDANPVHTYSSAGTYDVTLTVTNEGGSDTLTREGYISAYLPAPVAGFSASETSGTVPLAVSFTDSSLGDNLVYLWDFGDGTTSSEANPVHTYESAGTYDVSLTVTNEGGSDTLAREGYITASLPAPVAGFSAAETSGPVPLTVSFTDSSSGDNLVYSWDFGDGSTSSEASPVHTYTSAGTYDVTLTVTNYRTDVSDTFNREGYISAYLPAPVAIFSADDTSGTVPLTVSFTDSSSGDILVYSWDFGDGTTSSEASPVYTYESAGTYDVTLTVTNAGGSDTMTREDYITVSAGLEPPAVNFYLIGGVAITNQYTIFLDVSTDADGSIVSRIWDFGDGSTSSYQVARHKYTLPGDYDVTLTVIDSDGLSATTTRRIRVVASESYTKSFIRIS